MAADCDRRGLTQSRLMISGREVSPSPPEAPAGIEAESLGQTLPDPLPDAAPHVHYLREQFATKSLSLGPTPSATPSTISFISSKHSHPCNLRFQLFDGAPGYCRPADRNVSQVFKADQFFETRIANRGIVQHQVL